MQTETAVERTGWHKDNNFRRNVWNYYPGGRPEGTTVGGVTLISTDAGDIINASRKSGKSNRVESQQFRGSELDAALGWVEEAAR